MEGSHPIVTPKRPRSIISLSTPSEDARGGYLFQNTACLYMSIVITPSAVSATIELDIASMRLEAVFNMKFYTRNGIRRQAAPPRGGPVGTPHPEVIHPEPGF